MLSRRDFLVTAAAAAMASKIEAAETGVRLGKLVKGRKINIACVGCGGKGADDVRQFSGENIVGLCDVDYLKAQQTFQQHPTAKVYRDWREMLLELDDQIDAVVVSTPDHMHFPVALKAIEMGKHVYVQKPLTHTVEEARRLLEAARKHQVVTQMGNQGHSNESTRRMREWIEAGAIGDVTEVTIWTNRPVWPQDKELPGGQPVPPTLDWNRWLGVAPWRPYNRAFCPFDWRGWWEYGSGAIGDMGCHTMDAAFWALDLGAPEHVSSEVIGGSEYSCPKGSIVTYKFPARGKRPPVTLKWYDGCCHPERPAILPEGEKMPGSGQIFIGSKGAIFCPGDYCDSAKILPESLRKSFVEPPKTLPRVRGGNHYQNWLDGIRGVVEAPCSNFEHAVPLTEIALLGAVAVRSRSAFAWDRAALRCDNPAAQKFISKTYRMF